MSMLKLTLQFIIIFYLFSEKSSTLLKTIFNTKKELINNKERKYFFENKELTFIWFYYYILKIPRKAHLINYKLIRIDWRLKGLTTLLQIN